jgi:ASCH domain
MGKQSGQPTAYALSLRQPWAALLVHGRKSIEVRRWPTSLRRRILIHAARTPDPRPQAWALVPAELQGAAKIIGGIIGAADLDDCIAYHDPQSFRADRSRHLNDPSWFEEPVMYGFVFANPVVLPFRPYPGWVRFFSVKPEASPARRI